MSIAVKEAAVSEFTEVEVLSTEMTEPVSENAGPIKVVEGPKGDTGAPGPPGPRGEAFVYEDFTAEQLSALKETDHGGLLNRNAPGAHPIGAIEGLNEALESKLSEDEALTNEEIENILKGYV